MAEKVGISVRYTQSIEAGEYWPALPTLLKLRKALGGSWEEMFRGCGE
jgi:DNA-binding XRE family transcriptional regulator